MIYDLLKMSGSLSSLVALLPLNQKKTCPKAIIRTRTANRIISRLSFLVSLSHSSLFLIRLSFSHFAPFFAVFSHNFPPRERVIFTGGILSRQCEKGSDRGDNTSRNQICTGAGW